MPMNQVQFQHGMSLPDFFSRYGIEALYAAALAAHRWPHGFRGPRGEAPEHHVVGHGARKRFHCRGCRHQASLTIGTLRDSTKLPLRTGFLAICLISQAKTVWSALALKRHWGSSYRTAWRVHQKLMATLSERDRQTPLEGMVQLDDATLGGERPGVGGRGSPNKVPIVAAVSTSDDGRPLFVKINPLSEFTSQAITDWARRNLLPGCDVRSDGLNCFAGLIGAGCAHPYVVVGDRLPRELPRFKWVNRVLGNLKTMINGAHKAFKLRKYASQYLGAFC